jgi:hypothetical protein
MTVAVTTDSRTISFLLLAFRPSVKEINKGIFPKASTATNIGIKAKI